MRTRGTSMLIRFSLAMLAALAPSLADAALPRVLNYQGYLTSPGGTPVNATVAMQFSLYTSDSGGPAFYTEPHPSVVVTNGQFNVLIGGTVPIPGGIAFDQPYWLGIAVGADAEMSPRQALAASPYALHAATTDELGASVVVSGTQIAAHAITQSHLSPTSGAAPGAVLGTDGANLQWQAASGSVSGVSASSPLFSSGGTAPNISLTGIVPTANGGTGLGTAGTAGNVLRSDGAAWSSSALQAGDVPDLGASYIRNSSSLQASSAFNISNDGAIGGKLGVGTQSPGSKLHIYFPTAANAPRIETSGSNGREAGWDFWHGANWMGYIGVPGPSYPFAGSGEMTLYGHYDSPTSIWAGGARHLTFLTDGRAAFGSPADPLTGTKVTVRAGSFSTGLEATSDTSGDALWGHTGWGRGVVGYAQYSPGVGVAGYGPTGIYGNSGDGTAVAGETSTGVGVFGVSDSGTGVLGSTQVSSITKAGVRGVGNGLGSIGVIGESCCGTVNNPPTGVYGASSSNGGFGVYARNLSATSTGWALVAEGPRAALLAGDAQVTGTLSKAAGSFMIDHPLDPANKYLYHSFVESPDMMNIYNGNIVTDGNGHAVVALPDWFEALNGDFRYQLTVIGTFAQAIVEKKIRDNRFTIATNAPNVEVSWQVTGIRRDAYARNHRIPVEAAKPPGEQGTYLHPVELGQPREAALMARLKPGAGGSAKE